MAASASARDKIKPRLQGRGFVFCRGFNLSDATAFPELQSCHPEA